MVGGRESVLKRDGTGGAAGVERPGSAGGSTARDVCELDELMNRGQCNAAELQSKART